MPSRKAIQAIKDKVSAKTYRSTRHMDPDELIQSINRTLAGWANYFRHGVSKAVFSAIDYSCMGPDHALATAQVQTGKLRIGMPELRRRFCVHGMAVRLNGVGFTGASSVAGDPLPLPRQHHTDPVGTPAGPGTS